MSTTSIRASQANPLANLQAVTTRQLRVGEHVVDLGSLRVTTAVGCPKLTPKAASVLLELARQAGQTVTHDGLLDSVWAGTCPTRNVLTQAIKELRRVLPDPAGQGCIETIPKIGYRLTVPAALLEPERVEPAFEPRPAELAIGRAFALDISVDAFATFHALRAGILVAAILVLLVMLASSPDPLM